MINKQQASCAPTPSVAATSSNFRATQAERHPIYDGRQPLSVQNSGTIAMPTSLYHPVFRQWCIRALDTEFKVPPEVVAATAKLMQASSVLYSSEDARKKATRGHLQNAISHSIPTVKNDDGTTPDGRTSVEVNYEHSARAVLVMVDEEKHDSAERG